MGISAEALLERARRAALRAHAPYSDFRVGAAVVDAAGSVFEGCNVESASFGLSLCAERVALFAAVAAAARRPFAALAVSCVDAAATDSAGRMPCGACRQVAAEHLAEDAPVYVDGVGSYSLRELLPVAFAFGAPAASDGSGSQ